MEKEDKKRYFIVGSVYLEVVTPLFQQKLEENYKSQNLRCLKDFLDKKEVIHILFHLRHRNAKCCTDKGRCRNYGAFPLNHPQWKQLYAENPEPDKHNCFCKYTAKSIELKNLDVSLCSLILLNCCELRPLDREAIKILRQNKNDYLSHNTTCGITEDEFDSLMDELKTKILQLDQTKEDELIRIQNRPLDDSLCKKYVTYLLDNHEMLERIDKNTTRTDCRVEQIWRFLTTQSFTMQNLDEETDIQANLNYPIKPYILGQFIFTQYDQINLSSSKLDVGGIQGIVTDMVMMDDGKLVMCVPHQQILLVGNIDGSELKEDSIDVQDVTLRGAPIEGIPLYVTEVNNYTVAVTLDDSEWIHIYDIHNKIKLKSILVLGMWHEMGITTVNNKLVVGGDKELLIVNHHTEAVVQTVQTDCPPCNLYGSGDRIFYCNFHTDNKLYWYSFTDRRHHTLTLPAPTKMMTTLLDGSLYVVCEDGSIQHVSSDGKQHEPVETLESISLVQYNFKQRKLVIRRFNHFEIFNEVSNEFN